MLMSACEKAKTLADRVGPSREGARVVVRGEQKRDQSRTRSQSSELDEDQKIYVGIVRTSSRFVASSDGKRQQTCA